MIIQNDKSLYYIYGNNYIFKINNYDGIVQHICNFNKHIYIYTNTNKVVHIDNLNVENTYVFNTISNDPVIKIYACSSLFADLNIIAIVRQFDDNKNDIHYVYIDFCILSKENYTIIKLQNHIYISIKDSILNNTLSELINDNSLIKSDDMYLYYSNIYT
jgi:hypothetical protein